jgi:hypothetical protein
MVKTIRLPGASVPISYGVAPFFRSLHCPVNPLTRFCPVPRMAANRIAQFLGFAAQGIFQISPMCSGLRVLSH